MNIINACFILIAAFLLSFRHPGGHGREQGVRELWFHLHAAVEARRHGPLSLQRLRPLQQNEWAKPAINQTAEKDGKETNRETDR